MPQRSAGLLMYRCRHGTVEVLLVHPGGPFWTRKDDGAWSIPKGLFEEGEDPEATARREFEEETGQAPDGPLVALGVFRQPSGKRLHAFATEGEFDLASFRSNSFAMEWPPRSGRISEFPEADRAAWFGEAEALVKITRGQRPIVAALLDQLREVD